MIILEATTHAVQIMWKMLQYNPHFNAECYTWLHDERIKKLHYIAGVRASKKVQYAYLSKVRQCPVVETPKILSLNGANIFFSSKLACLHDTTVGSFTNLVTEIQAWRQAVAHLV